jgi:hypothetical protein
VSQYDMDWERDHYIGHLGRQDSEYDNTLAEHAEYVPARPRQLSAWKVALLVIGLIPWSLVALLFARYKFMLHTR